MGIAEMTECFGVMRAAWPSAEIFRQDKDGQLQSIALWARLAADIPAEIGKATVMELVTSRKFPPSISEFLEAARAKMPRPELEAHDGPTLEEGMRMNGEMRIAIRAYDEKLYRKLGHTLAGGVTYLPGILGRKLTVGSYRFGRKMIQF